MPFARRQARKRRHVDECLRTGRRIPGRSCLQSAFRAERRKVASSAAPRSFPSPPCLPGTGARRKRHRPAPPRQGRTLLSEKAVPKSVLPVCGNPRPRLQHPPLTKVRTGAWPPAAGQGRRAILPFRTPLYRNVRCVAPSPPETPIFDIRTFILCRVMHEPSGKFNSLLGIILDKKSFRGHIHFNDNVSKRRSCRSDLLPVPRSPSCNTIPPTSSRPSAACP